MLPPHHWILSVAFASLQDDGSGRHSCNISFYINHLSFHIFFHLSPHFSTITHCRPSTVYYIYGMDLFTKIDIPAADWQIDYTSRLVFLGSCFADNISTQFAKHKFHVLANPFGTVYNPISLARQIKAIASQKVFEEKDVFQDKRSDGLWHCWDAHSSLSAKSCEECISKLNAAVTRTREYLFEAKGVFITLGTAFVYARRDSGEVVANCHRQDASLFTRRMISVEEAAEALGNIVRDLRKINEDLHIVFTVSPLRHLGDGAHQNTLSKATLQMAIKSHATSSYFPSYEIVMDELRDYRFYDTDLIHLSTTAEEYIFERMAESFCSETTRENISKVDKFLKNARHRVGDSQHSSTLSFAQKNLAQAATLEKQIRGLDLSDEKVYFNDIFNNTIQHF